MLGRLVWLQGYVGMAIQDFLESVKTGRSNAHSTPLQFLRLDTETMAKRMKLREKAAEAGKANLPASNSVVPDATEQEIINEVEGEAKASFDKYLEIQKSYSDRAVDANIQGMVLEIEAAADTAVADFNRKTQVGRSDLYPLKRAAVETDDELLRFRAAEGLKGPAHRFEGRVLKVGILALISVFEVGANATFFMQGSELGYVGGAFVAFFVALINIGAAVLVGMLVLPWIWYKNWFVKFLGAIGVLIYLFGVTYLNLAVAHFRAAAATHELSEAGSVVAGKLWPNPFLLPDFQSWILFGVGMIFAIVALIDAFVMDDPYPGYGRRTRDNLKALRRYADEHDFLTQDLEDIKTDAEEKIEKVARSIQASQGVFSDLTVRSQAIQASINEHFTHLDGAANHLLSIYRDENRRNRTDEAPARFSELWQYRRPDTAMSVIPDHLRKNLDATLETAMARIPQCRDKMYVAYNEALTEYKRIDDLTVGDLRK